MESVREASNCNEKTTEYWVCDMRRSLKSPEIGEEEELTDILLFLQKRTVIGVLNVLPPDNGSARLLGRKNSLGDSTVSLFSKIDQIGDIRLVRDSKSSKTIIDAIYVFVFFIWPMLTGKLSYNSFELVQIVEHRILFLVGLATRVGRK